MAGKKKGEAGKGRPGSGCHAGEKNGKRRTPAARTIDKGLMLDLMRRGYSQSSIARKLNVAQSTISHDWKQVLEELNKARVLDRDCLVALKIEQYDHVITEALEAFEDSKTVTSRDKKGQLRKRKTKPDPRFLGVVMEAYKALRELQGLDQPKKLDVKASSVPWDEALDGQGVGSNYQPKRYDAQQAINDALNEPGRQLGNGLEEVKK